MNELLGLMNRTRRHRRAARDGSAPYPRGISCLRGKEDQTGFAGGDLLQAYISMDKTSGLTSSCLAGMVSYVFGHCCQLRDGRIFVLTLAKLDRWAPACRDMEDTTCIIFNPYGGPPYVQRDACDVDDCGWVNGHMPRHGGRCLYHFQSVRWASACAARCLRCKRLR